ncbi:M36 family metallopeptidase [Jatrophihabitans sp. YIM 134969]
MLAAVTGAVLTAGVAVAVTVVAPPATAVVDGVTPPSDTTVDVRRGAHVAPTAAAVAGLQSLLATAAAAGATGTRASWNPELGTLRSVRAASGYLTGPRSGSAVDTARDWSWSHSDALGLTRAQVDTLAVVRDHALPVTGTHVVTFAQVYQGVTAAQGGRLNVAVTRDGRVLSYTGNPLPGATVSGTWSKPLPSVLLGVSKRLAPGVTFVPTVVDRVAGYTHFAAGPFFAGSYVKKAVFGTASGPRAAFRVLFVKAGDQAWDTVVDAVTGAELFRTSAVAHEFDPHGTVYDNYPGAARGGTPVVRSFGPTPESPAGWVDPTGLLGTGVTTLGNNANTYANWSNYLVPADMGPRPVDPLGHFDQPYTNQWKATGGQTVPPSYALDVDAAATNLFYQHNRIHDEYYRLGFTETAGNFQVSNGTAGGMGGDPVLGLVQAGAASGGAPTYTGRDNAYMLTLDDGIPPWSGMFLWEPIDDSFEGGYSDGDFDASVIQHEYTHGLSTRYVAGGSALNSQQAGSMGEGWSDWYALNHLFNAGLQSKPVVGKYVTGNTVTGIRNWDYDQNPLTFGDIGYDLTGPEVHADGEIWTAMLWDLRKALVAKYGAAAGAERAARIVTDGMPLTAPDPSFLDARDGILSADLDRYAGQDTALIWRVFAKRGAGFSAISRTGDDVDPVPAFDVPTASANGRLPIVVVNATTAAPVVGAKVVLGKFEARVSQLGRTGTTGGLTVTATPATYPVTIQAAGFGVQTVRATVVAGANPTLRIELAPNLASTALGATVVSTNSEDPGSPARFAFDDSAASTWSTAPSETTIAEQGPRTVVVKLATAATVSSVRVSAFKATTASRFDAVKAFRVQTSRDGKSWSNALAGRFGYRAPRPTAPDLNFTTFRLAKPTKATYVRFVVDATLGQTSTQAQVADVEVFGASGPVGNGTVVTDPPFTDTGTIAAPNPAAGDPTGLANVFGVTGTEFTSSCSAPPTSQGLDGWVTTLPAGFGDGRHTVTVSGTGGAEATLGHDVDLYFLDSSCALVGSSATAATDESTSIPPGAVYVLTQLYLGADVEITVRATDTR